jgi:hypothetical protein
MSHVVKREPWGTLDIDTHDGRIFFQQTWLYSWTTQGAGIAAWTLAEKRHFHNTADKQIWSAWSMRITLRVAGTSAFARKFGAKGVPINFDVKWVLKGGNWTVNAIKVAPTAPINTHRSFVIFASRSMTLYSIALTPYAAGNDAGKSNAGFLTAPHEFGHQIGAPDEYNAGHAHLGDEHSIMNVGKNVRDRHLGLIIRTLNTMIPQTTFSM